LQLLLQKNYLFWIQRSFFRIAVVMPIRKRFAV